MFSPALHVIWRGQYVLRGASIVQPDRERRGGGEERERERENGLDGEIKRETERETGINVYLKIRRDAS